jgi:hypothetical protein
MAGTSTATSLVMMQPLSSTVVEGRRLEVELVRDDCFASWKRPSRSRGIS